MSNPRPHFGRAMLLPRFLSRVNCRTLSPQHCCPARIPLQMAVLVFALLGVACSQGGPTRLAEAATELGYKSRLIIGEGFTHEIHLNRSASTLPLGSDQNAPNSPLHVYIDGDGVPLLGRNRPSADPTPRDFLTLRLMALDPNPAIYLGRPCYGSLTAEETCTTWHWTEGRYSESVVLSMVAAINRVCREKAPSEVVLIGYSGGGALAMLMAPRIANATGVVTVAGNLDVQAWTRYHRYKPLTGSLNPADEDPLPAHIRQWHWLGARDTVVPPRIVKDMLSRETNAQVTIVPDATHGCCWEEVWPTLLGRLQPT